MVQYRYSYRSPLGLITLTASDKGLTSLSLPEYKYDVPVCSEHIENKLMFEDLVSQLDRYFSGEAFAFNVALDLQGTAFQQRIWEMLQKIPAGETRCYGDLANQIGKPNASRAVGAANGQNPIAIIVPCHRIIGKNGKLTGYAGGLAAKAWLLAHEKTMKC
ncbi:methylated-DNA--[protein]-cysteine S-methyltransferase [Enterovibrio nigricans]|uniref:Methylated-DNA--protein-cysteine methyltransferase n=1 Tax=Enterovibrio nigricans DSM 22720 TaxID=1121868 RepID=A0A1T4UDX8_9GAMM|nr:methylated-DNA--[protein]-cysteine S-methyltransferase [Enterovibrio nigricans]PKF50742.1 methylated-DNA--[protein]-cysteine S-methyltransferase [Enterovibrio nigricans]SKA50853.1 methylated-DNA-[protein]-cysteine S-methyltransferase [Enterovibrio nigricans DSM 22720]